MNDLAPARHEDEVVGQDSVHRGGVVLRDGGLVLRVEGRDRLLVVGNAGEGGGRLENGKRADPQDGRNNGSLREEGPVKTEDSNRCLPHFLYIPIVILKPSGSDREKSREPQG